MILLFAFLAATAQQQVFDLLADVASALSAGNYAAFRDAFAEKNTKLQTNVAALLERADVLASLDFLGEEGSDTARTVQLDWFLQIRDKQDAGPLVRRRERVTCKLEKRGRKWKIVSLEPESLFDPHYR